MLTSAIKKDRQTGVPQGFMILTVSDTPCTMKMWPMRFIGSMKPIACYMKTHSDPKETMTTAAAAYLIGGYPMKALADAFGLRYATVGRAVNRYEKTQKEQ